MATVAQQDQQEGVRLYRLEEVVGPVKQLPPGRYVALSPDKGGDSVQVLVSHLERPATPTEWADAVAAASPSYAGRCGVLRIAKGGDHV